MDILDILNDFFIQYGDDIKKIFLAMILGGTVGFERELHRQPAGLRTHIIVCVGACLITIASIKIATRYTAGTVDPTRITAQIVSGIGFLGAGAILRYGASVKGLTTAACLWAVSGIGLAIGLSFYAESIIATFFILFTTLVLDRVEKSIIHGKINKALTVTLKDSPGIIGLFEDKLQKLGITIKSLGMNKILLEQKIELHCVIKIPDTLDIDALNKEISVIDGIERIDIE